MKKVLAVGMAVLPSAGAAVRVLIKRSRARCSVARLYCSKVLTGTKRLAGRPAASHMAPHRSYRFCRASRMA